MQSLAQTLSAINTAVPALQRALLASTGAHAGQYTWSARNVDYGPWLLCDGREVPIARYPELFSVIGHRFGEPSTPDMFVIPDMRGRVMAGTVSDEVHPMGETTGEETHTLVLNEIPAHNHGGATGGAGAHTHGTNAGAGSAYGLAIVNGLATTVNTDNSNNGEINTSGKADLVVDGVGNHSHSIASAGGGMAHNNMQPTAFAGNLFICVGVHDYMVQRQVPEPGS